MVRLKSKSLSQFELGLSGLRIFISNLPVISGYFTCSWHIVGIVCCCFVCLFCNILQNVEILLAGNRLSSYEVLGGNQNLIVICTKAPSGSLGKSLFSLSSWKETFECLMQQSLNILSCHCPCKHPVYSRVFQTNTCQRVQLYHNFHWNLCATDIAQVFLPRLSVRLVISGCFRTAYSRA